MVTFEQVTEPAEFPGAHGQHEIMIAGLVHRIRRHQCSVGWCGSEGQSWSGCGHRNGSSIGLDEGRYPPGPRRLQTRTKIF
jgi:hypothetical protein